MVAETTGSRRRLKEKSKKNTRKKNSEVAPPVELMIESTTNVKITDSNNLEEIFFCRTNFLQTKRMIKRKAEICKSYWERELFDIKKDRMIVKTRTAECTISLDILLI